MRSPADVLQVTSDVFTALLRARPGFDLPKRKVILAGDFPYDTEEFAVWTGIGMYPGFPGQPVTPYQSATGGFVPLSMMVNVSILRNVPLVDNTGRLPSGDVLNKSSLVIVEDGRALGECFYEAYNANTLAPYQDNLALTGVSFFGPQGGLGETRLTFTIQL
jgi:hypothetical protein